FPDLDPAQIPMAAPVVNEKGVYLLDPVGATRRTRVLRASGRCLRALGKILGVANDAVELPYTPSFLHKKDGLVLSIGQFNQWVGSQMMSSGAVQIWPEMPVDKVLIE